MKQTGKTSNDHTPDVKIAAAVISFVTRYQ